MNERTTPPDTISVHSVIQTLNELFEKDPAAIETLITLEAETNIEIARDDRVSSYVSPGRRTLRVIGLLNAIFGRDSLGWGVIVAKVDNDRLVGFCHIDDVTGPRQLIER